jgi:hypothetical protein
VSGPQGPRGRPEERGAEQGGLDEGCMAWPRGAPQGQRIGGHGAKGGRVHVAGQETCRQGLGQLLLQGQFGLEERNHRVFSMSLQQLFNKLTCRSGSLAHATKKRFETICNGKQKCAFIIGHIIVVPGPGSNTSLRCA